MMLFNKIKGAEDGSKKLKEFFLEYKAEILAAFLKDGAISEKQFESVLWSCECEYSKLSTSKQMDAARLIVARAKYLYWNSRLRFEKHPGYESIWYCDLCSNIQRWVKYKIPNREVCGLAEYQKKVVEDVIKSMKNPDQASVLAKANERLNFESSADSGKTFWVCEDCVKHFENTKDETIVQNGWDSIRSNYTEY